MLSLPGGRLHEFPGAAPQAAELPAFTVLQVFQEATNPDGARWLEVGRGEDCESKEGWLDADLTEDWKTMLVMQFAPRGSRERVLFFRDGEALAATIEAGYAAEDAEYAYQSIEDGNPERDIFVAIEPKTPTSFGNQPFLMPILDWTYREFLDGTNVTLLEVAGLNVNPEASVSAFIQEDATGCSFLLWLLNFVTRRLASSSLSIRPPPWDLTWSGPSRPSKGSLML